MIQLLLTRHCKALSADLGENEEVLCDEDDELSEEGRAQGRALAEHLSSKFIAASIISSPIKRASETAKYLARAYGTEAIFDPRLREREFAFPIGTTTLKSRMLQEESYLHPDALPLGGESVAQHRMRAADWLSEFEASLSNHQQLTQIVVAHGGTIEHLQACLTGSSLSFMSRMFTACDTGHYHLWTVVRPLDGRLVWRLDGVNLGP